MPWSRLYGSPWLYLREWHNMVHGANWTNMIELGYASCEHDETGQSRYHAHARQAHHDIRNERRQAYLMPLPPRSEDHLAARDSQNARAYR